MTIEEKLKNDKKKKQQEDYAGMSIVTEQGAFEELGIDNSVKTPDVSYDNE